MLTVKSIKEIFSDFNFQSTKKVFYKKMKWHSDQLEFEKANDFKIKLNLTDRLQKSMNPIKLRQARQRCQDIKSQLGLKFSPTVIDAFDNSHNAGSDAVCGLVRYNLLQPDKNGYRKYIIKSGVGGDDIHSFEEVLNRRFKRMLEEKQNLPNLIIIDGGKTQLNIARKVVESHGLSEKLDLISISKDDKHKPCTIHLSSGGEFSIKNFVEFAKIIEEVHRFAINFHKDRSSKRLFKSKRDPK